MGSTLNPKDQELYNRTDEVLHYLWDPIGVAGIPTARDEYYGYIPKIISLLKENASVEQIATHLDLIAVEHIGINSDIIHSQKIASILTNWHETIAQKYA